MPRLQIDLEALKGFLLDYKVTTVEIIDDGQVVASGELNPDITAEDVDELLDHTHLDILIVNEKRPSLFKIIFKWTAFATGFALFIWLVNHLAELSKSFYASQGGK